MCCVAKDPVLISRADTAVRSFPVSPSDITRLMRAEHAKEVKDRPSWKKSGPVFVAISINNWNNPSGIEKKSIMVPSH